VALVALAAPIVLAAPAAPPTTAPLSPVLYTGAGFGPRITVGATCCDSATPFLGLGGRVATVLQLWDLDLHARVLLADEPVWGADAGARLHPLFPFLFHESAWLRLLGALNVRLGLGLQGARSAGARPIWAWGVGLDAPITDRDAGKGWWIGAEFGHFAGWTSVREGDDVLGAANIDALSLSLEYRINGL
jgi:hypothetical protein